MNLPYKLHQLASRVIPAPVMFQLSLRALLARNWWRYGESNFPVTIAIETNAHCNRKCYYCPVSIDPKAVEIIKPDVYSRCLDRIAELDWRGIIDFHFFGEPLLNVRLESLVREARARCPRAILEILTNGDALTVRRAQSLLAAGIDKFLITRHPPYSDEWDARMESLVAMFPDSIACRTIDGLPLHNRTGMVKPRTTFDFSKGCHTASRHFQIGIHGEYVWCCSDYDKRHLQGNVFNHSILEAWKNNLKYRAARKAVESGKPILDICKACFSGKPL
jgi:2-deoxy-scyllo-inosamine dehydrogenase (SAM-dependent)